MYDMSRSDVASAQVRLRFLTGAVAAAWDMAQERALGGVAGRGEPGWNADEYMRVRKNTKAAAMDAENSTATDEDGQMNCGTPGGTDTAYRAKRCTPTAATRPTPCAA